MSHSARECLSKGVQRVEDDVTSEKSSSSSLASTTTTPSRQVRDLMEGDEDEWRVTRKLSLLAIRCLMRRGSTGCSTFDLTDCPAEEEKEEEGCTVQGPHDHGTGLRSGRECCAKGVL